MNHAKRAKCPLCRASVKTFWWNGKRIYEGHGGPIVTGEFCDATGWLVEDDELIA